MAKSKLNYNKTIVSKMTIKGILSEDGKTITYFDEDEDIEIEYPDIN